MSLAAQLKAKLVDLLPDPVVFRVAPTLYRRQEPELAQITKFVPNGKVSVDVGGWLGPWTHELAKISEHVHTFEPQPNLAAYLRKVVPQNVTVHECALSSEPGEMPLHLPSGEHGSNALASLRSPDETTSEMVVHSVKVSTLDDFGFTNVGFIKIDVEGHERELLLGAEQTIANNRPRILLEAEQRHVDYPITELFDSLKNDAEMTGWFLHGGKWHPIEHFNVQRDQTVHLDNVVGADYVNNFLFVPQQDSFRPQ